MPDPTAIGDPADFTPMPLPGGVVSQDRADDLTPVPFQFSDIRALAARILKRAQEQAQQKLDAARAQIAAMEKEAREKAYKEAFPKGEKEGFAKGEADGKSAADAAVKLAVESERTEFKKNSEPATAALEQLMAEINGQRQHLIAQAEADLLLLALDLAKRLVGHELSVDREAIRPLAAEAIGLVTDRSSLIARVHPEDLDVLDGSIPEIKALFPDLGAVRIEADSSLERGGIIVATREAEVDMRLSTRLAAFEDAILGYSGKQAEAPWSAIDPAETARQMQAVEAAKAAARQASAFVLPESGQPDAEPAEGESPGEGGPEGTEGSA